MAPNTTRPPHGGQQATHIRTLQEPAHRRITHPASCQRGRFCVVVGAVLCWFSCLGGCLTAGPGDKSATSDRGNTGAGFARDFDQDPPGRVPAGWRIAQTNPTEAMASWSVKHDVTAPSGDHVFALTASKNYNGTYNLAIAEDSIFGNINLTVKVMAVDGEEDQGGGPIWRCRDQNNYYICRFNPLEGNYRVYVVKDGRRKQLATAYAATTAGKWYTVRVKMKDDLITCYLDGEKLLETRDDTFEGPGMVGLWTKADAVTSFDDLAVAPLR